MKTIHNLYLLILASVFNTPKGTGEGYLELDIQVTFFNTSFVQLVCFSEKGTLLCVADFLFNMTTLNELKWENSSSSCYSTNGKCPPATCTCDQSCKKFVLNVTIPQNLEKHTFGCVTRFGDGDGYYQKKISKEYNSTGHRLDKDNQSDETISKSNHVHTVPPDSCDCCSQSASFIGSVSASVVIGALIMLMGII